MNEAQGAFVWVLPDAHAMHAKARDAGWARLAEQSDDTLRSFAVIAIQQSSQIKLKVEDTQAPDFIAKLRAAIARGLKKPLTFPYGMPLKRGGTLHVDIVNPFASCTTLSELSEQNQLYESVPEGRTIDVWQKQQNTRAMLTAAQELTSSFLNL